MAANYSAERREHALALIRSKGILTDIRLPYESKLSFAIGTLICDDSGKFTNRQLTDALADPSIVAAARELLRKAGE